MEYIRNTVMKKMVIYERIWRLRGDNYKKETRDKDEDNRGR